MDLLLGALAAALLVVAGYAHFRIASHTAGARRAVLTRGVLALVGLALGYVMAASYAGDRASALLVFLIAFGAVHVPAAFILFLKRARGEGRS